MNKISIFRRYITTLCLVLILLFFANFSIGDAKDTKSLYISSEELPDLIIAYSYYCSRYLDEFKALKLDSNSSFGRLERNLDQLKLDISTRLAFTHRSFIVQDIKNYFAGYKKIRAKSIEISKIPYENILFVTTPLEALDNHILIFLSSVGPEQSTIVEIDNELNTKLLYDTFTKRVNIAMGSIYQIKVISPGNFLLEGGIRAQTPSQPTYFTFTYILKIIDSNTVNIREIRNKEEQK